jgi:CubicO group peptidase (beta-lactamase class C family)
MQLVESKHLDLDQDINKYLNKPIFHPLYPSHRIALCQLLSHTASINANTDLQSSSIGFPP